MKKLLLVAFCSLSILTNNLNAQCVGSPDPGCMGSNGPCGSLHDGTAGQPYIDTISFWAPQQVDATVQSGGLYSWVDFLQFQIADVTGLPAGLTWTCGNGTCIYDPQPAGILANFTVCGTPIAPGNYTLHITIIGTVDILGGSSGSQYYDIPLTILPPSGGNSVFNFTPSQGCDSALVSFTPIMNFPLPQITGYNWDFGGGNVSSVTTTTPIVIDYTTTGIYPVTCTTTVYNMVLTDFHVSVGAFTWWCGDIEEATCGNGNADIIPTFTTGVTNWVGAEIDDNPDPNWGSINYVISNTSYSINLMEYDPVSANDYPAGPVTGTISGIGVYTFSLPGNYYGGFTINAVPAGQFIATDTVFIYATPPMDTIVATSTSFCPYDSVTLSVDPGYYYEWYLNDTVQVQAGTNNTYITSDAGSYTVVITDPVSGCNIATDPVTLTSLPIVPPGFPNVGINETPPGTYHSILPGGYTYQWLYFDGINYSAIPAPAGTAPDYTPTFNGMYCLIATNAAGCTDTSNCLGFHLGIENTSTPFMANVYPNPTDGLINVTVANLIEDATLNVYNMVGQRVYSVNVQGTGSVNEQHDLSFLTEGMYILELTNKQHRYTSKIIVK
jgi:hypothetical protein